jgi:ABC-type glycerol-3-phosphate transport system substrate-binding protein
MKRALFLLFTVLITVSLFAGGGSQSQSGGAAKGETVTIYTRFTSYPCWPKMIKVVEEKTGIKINSVTAPTEYSDFVTKISSALTVGDSSYDIFDVDELLGVTFISAGFLAPINDVAQPVLKDFNPAWMDTISKGTDGNYYMIPSGYSAIFLYVNKVLFSNSNVKYPTNLNEFITAAQTLTKSGVYGLGSAWMQGGYMFNDIVRNIYAFNGDFYDWNNPNTQKAIQFMYDQLYTYNITPQAAISDDYSQANQKFADSRYAMLFMWQNGYDAVSDQWQNYDIIPIPTFNTNKTIINSWGFGLNKNSKKMAAAKEVLKAITSPEAMACLLEVENSPHLGVLASPAAEVIPYNRYLRAYGEAGSLYPRPMPTTVNEIQNIMETNVSAFVSKQIDLATCVKNVNEGIKDLKPKK